MAFFRLGLFSAALENPSRLRRLLRRRPTKKIPPATQANKLHKENFQILDLNDTLENQIEHGYYDLRCNLDLL